MGECNADYKIQIQGAESVKIERSKSLSKCGKIAMTGHTSLPGPLQRLPIISSEQSCLQKITAGVMEEVTCEESIVLAPAGANEGTTTRISTKLKLTDTKPVTDMVMTGISNLTSRNMCIIFLNFECYLIVGNDKCNYNIYKYARKKGVNCKKLLSVTKMLCRCFLNNYMLGYSLSFMNKNRVLYS